MSNDQHLDDGMERLEIGQSQVQVPRDINITPNVEFKLRKQFNNPEFIENAWERSFKNPNKRRSLFVHYSEW